MNSHAAHVKHCVYKQSGSSVSKRPQANVTQPSIHPNFLDLSKGHLKTSTSPVRDCDINDFNHHQLSLTN